MIITLATAAFACPPCNDFDFNEGDYSEITDWNEVDQAQIPLERVNEIPSSELKYNELTSAQKKEMSAQQIAGHLDEIKNIATDVNFEEATQAIKDTTGITITSFGKSSAFNLGILSTKSQQFDTNNKEGWEIAIDDKGTIQVLKPTTVKVDDISTKDEFVFSEEITLLKESGFPIKVKGLQVKDAQMFVAKGKTATVGGFEIGSNKNSVAINFNPFLKPEGNVVTLSPQGMDITTTNKGSIDIVGVPGNELFVMQRYDEFSESLQLMPDERATLAITISGGDSLAVSDRSKDDKTPLITHSNNGGKVQITTGRLEIVVKKDQVMTRPPLPSHKTGNYDNSVAFEFKTDKDTVNEVFRTSSSNRFVFLQDGTEVIGNNAGSRVSDEREPNLMKTYFDLQRKYADLTFQYEWSEEEKEKGIEYGVTANSAQLLDEWLEPRQGMQEFIPHFVMGREINTVYDSDTQQMELGEHNLDLSSLTYHALEGDVGRNLDSPFDVFEHEFDHAIDTKIAASENQGEGKGIEELYEEERNAIMADLENSEAYQKQWKKIKNNKGFARHVLDEDYDESAISQMGKMGLSSENIKGRTIDYAISLGLFNDAYSDLKRDSKKLEAIIHEETGLAGHAFRTGTELEAIYGELEIQEAKRYPQLAQLEYDRIMSLKNAPDWLVEPAQERYWSIMGGPHSDYCKKNGCGKCVLYTKTCTP